MTTSYSAAVRDALALSSSTGQWTLRISAPVWSHAADEFVRSAKRIGLSVTATTTSRRWLRRTTAVTVAGRGADIAVFAVTAKVMSLVYNARVV